MNAPLAKLVLAVGTGVLAGLGLVEAQKNSQRRAALQRAFTNFHDRIKHEQHGERDLLRERRETLTARLRQELPAELKLQMFNQGSYALQTGVKPATGEFDIDVGLVLECSRSYFGGPVETKQWVRDALVQGSRSIKIRRSCVTVNYTDKEFGSYHVDLAVYVQELGGQQFLAKGKEHSQPDLKFWEPAAPEKLTELLNGKFSGLAVGQFRRCIRYLKRWKQFNFESQAPYSIALTIAAYRWFEPRTRGVWEDEPDDLEALRALTMRMLAEFNAGRLRVPLPVSPGIDLMERLTPAHMQRFRQKLEELSETLTFSRSCEDLDDALTRLGSQFGPEFH